MEFRGYQLTATKQNMGIHYFRDNKMTNLDHCNRFNLNGHFHGSGSGHYSNPTDVLHDFTKMTKGVQMPFTYPYPVAYDSKKKFEHHKKAFNTVKQNNLAKDSMDTRTINMDYSQYFGSKSNQTMSSTICSQIVGGFVGSKSQINNGKAMSCNLGSFIFNVLNNLNERIVKSKNIVNSTVNTNLKSQHGNIIEKSSQSKAKECIDKNVNFGNVIDDKPFQHNNKIPMEDSNQCAYSKNGQTERNSTESRATDTLVNLEDNTTENNLMIEDCMEGFEKETCMTSENSKMDSEDSNSSIMAADVREDSLQQTKEDCNENRIQPDKIPSIKISDELDGCPIFKMFGNCSEFIRCPSTVSKLRLQSECSVDSTDSDSYIVFDDRLPECMVEDDDINEEEEDEYVEEEDEECTDDYESSVSEANAKWSACYENVQEKFDESDRKVKFNDKISVHIMIAWDYAYRAARPGPWEQYARDRVRFQDRIDRLGSTLSPILHQEHRNKIYRRLYS